MRWTESALRRLTMTRSPSVQASAPGGTGPPTHTRYPGRRSIRPHTTASLADPVTGEGDPCIVAVGLPSRTAPAPGGAMARPISPSEPHEDPSPWRPPPPITWRDRLDSVTGQLPISPLRLLGSVVAVLAAAGAVWWLLRPP